jgi:hypothetical protein
VAHRRPLARTGERMTEDIVNRTRWVLALVDGLKHEAASNADVRRHLGRAKSSLELAVERLTDEGQDAA